MVKELSIEQFWEEFVTAYQANDAARIQQIITANPNTAQELQQQFTEAGKSTGENANAKQHRAIAEILEQFRSGDFSSILDSLQEEGEQAYYASDYQSALKKFRDVTTASLDRQQHPVQGLGLQVPN